MDLAPSHLRSTLGGNPWNCCNLEPLRAFLPLQDITYMTCLRPQLVAGLALSATTGPIGTCSQG